MKRILRPLLGLTASVRREVIRMLAVGLLLLFSGKTGSSAPPIGEKTGSPLVIIKSRDKALFNIAYGPDGQVLFTMGDCGLAVWDVTTGTRIREVAIEGGYRGRLSFSIDRKKAALRPMTSSAIHVIDTVTGKEVRRFEPLDTIGGALSSPALSPDGALLAAESSDPPTVYIWDVKSGKKLHQWKEQDQIRDLDFSPDGRLLAIISGVSVCLRDLRSGQELHRLVHRATGGLIKCSKFSLDSTLLATLTRSSDRDVHLWDVQSGKLLKELGHSWGALQATLPIEARDGWRKRLALKDLEFSPDGRWIASAAEDNYIRLWELASGNEGPCWRTQLAEPLAFSPNGKTLVSGATPSPAGGGWPSSLAIWDRGKVCRGGKEGGTLCGEGLEAQWKELASPDAAKSSRAVWVLVASPVQAVARTETYLQAIPETGPARIRQLLAQLEDNRFALREKAEQELFFIGERAKASLTVALRKATNVEERKRISRLLDQIADSHHPTRLRHIRMVELLEHIRSPEAQRQLTLIGRGLLGPSAAMDAEHSIRRISREMELRSTSIP